MTDEKIEVPAFAFATGWLAVRAASGADPERPALCDTVLVEVCDGWVTLVSTDSTILLFTAIRTGDHTPTIEDVLETAPQATYVAIDDSGRASSMLTYVRKSLRKPESDMGEMLALYEGEVDEELTRPLFPRHGLVITSDAERVVAPLYEGSFPTWRSLVAQQKEKGTTAITFSTEILKVMSSLPGVGVQFSLGGASAVTAIKAHALDDRAGEVWGLAMPLVLA